MNIDRNQPEPVLKANSGLGMLEKATQREVGCFTYRSSLLSALQLLACIFSSSESSPYKSEPMGIRLAA